MIIHVVKSGDSLYHIAHRYDSSVRALSIANGIENPDNLSVGRALVIPIPMEKYIAADGDNLETVSEILKTSIGELWRDNPELGGVDSVYPGQEIDTFNPFDRKRSFVVGGYVYPFADEAVLRRTLPYLTYIADFSYSPDYDGGLIAPDDERILSIIRDYDVMPVMSVTTLDPDGRYDSALAHTILNSPQARARLISEIIDTMNAKGFGGVDFDFEYIPPADRDAYSSFVREAAEAINAAGGEVLTALAPKYSDDQQGILYEAHDYHALGEAANAVLLMTYEWGYSYGPPLAVAPIDNVRRVVEYALTTMPAEKILLGIPNYGYDWTLPYESNQPARSLSNVEAANLAAEKNVEIKYDPVSQSPYFNYKDENGFLHEVHFEDARSIEAKLALADEYGLRGVTYWNLMKYFPQNWEILNSEYEIEKV